MKRFIVVFAIFIFAGLNLYAEQVKSIDFTGTTKTEKVVLTINDKAQVLEYYTPRRDIKYSILDYDYQNDNSTNSKLITATVLDPIFNTAYEVLIYSNSSFADMRIGKKRITFSYVDDFRVKE